MKTVSTDFENNELAVTNTPVEIYTIVPFHWRAYWADYGYDFDIIQKYTNNDKEITVDGLIYTPATISRESSSYNADLSVDTMDITFSKVVPEFIKYLTTSSITKTMIEVARVFRDQATIDKSIVFFGTISSVSIKGMAVVAHCEGFKSFLRQAIPTRKYQTQCNWVFGDTKCTKAITTQNLNNITVSSDGLTITHYSIDDHDKWHNGYIAKYSGWYGGTFSTITSNEIGVLTIRYPINGLTTGDSIGLYAGCNGAFTTCRDVHFNEANFGGFTSLPKENPTLWVNR